MFKKEKRNLFLDEKKYLNEPSASSERFDFEAIRLDFLKHCELTMAEDMAYLRSMGCHHNNIKIIYDDERNNGFDTFICKDCGARI